MMEAKRRRYCRHCGERIRHTARRCHHCRKLALPWKDYLSITAVLLLLLFLLLKYLRVL
jgi:predicted amidophosphoribosyltransferase